MEQNDNSLTLILVVVLVLGFVTSIVGRIPILFLNFDSIQFYYTIYPIFTIISIIIHPVLVFVVFYRLGKNFDLKLNLSSSIIRLLIGSYIGHFLASNIVQFIYGFEDTWEILSFLIGSIISLGFLSSFFVAFSALAIAYLKQNNHSVVQT